MIEYIISFTFLIAAVVLIRALCRKKIPPRIMYALWLVVIVRMLIPFPLIRVSMPEIIKPEHGVAETEENAPVSEDYLSEYIFEDKTDTDGDISSDTVFTDITDVKTDPVQPEINIIPETEADSNKDSMPETVQSLPEKNKNMSVQDIHNIVWAIGAAAFSVWFTVSGTVYFSRLHRQRKYYMTAGKTRVYLSECVNSPLVSGIVPVIYINREAAENSDVGYIIKHEMTHIAHGDNIWSILRILALVVFWYNPAVWLAAFLSKQDAEFAVDDSIAADLDESGRIDYARAILAAVPVKRGFVSGFGSAPLRERMLTLTERRKNSITALILAVVLTLSSAGCAFIGKKEEMPDETVVSDNTEEETKTVLLNTVTTRITPNSSYKYVAEYDEYGRLVKSTSYTDGEQFSVTEYTYDEYGCQNSEKFVTPEMSYIYEWTNNADKNRLKGTEKTEQANGLSSFESEYKYTYDEKGRMMSYDCTTVSQRAMSFGKTITEEHRTYEYTDEYGSYTMKEWGDNIPETVYQFFFDENGNIAEEIILTEGIETERTTFDSHGYALTSSRKTASGTEVTSYENSYENGLLTKMIRKNGDGKIIGTTVSKYDGEGNILSTVVTGEDGKETSNTVYEYEEFDVKVLTTYNPPVSKAEATALYDRFINEYISENSEIIKTREFRDLDFNGVDEYLVYVTSGYDWMCEIFTIEDGEVKAFTPYSASVGDGKTVPMAVNALKTPLYARPAKMIGTLRSFCVGTDTESGEKVTVLLSESMHNTHEHAELFVFSPSYGRLKAATECKYEWSKASDGAGETLYSVNGRSVEENKYTEKAREVLRSACEKYGIDTLTEFAGIKPVKRSNLDGFSYNPSKRTVRFGSSESVTLGENDALLILNGSVAPLDAIYTDAGGKYHIKVSAMEELGVMTSVKPDEDGFILWDDYESGANQDHYYPRNGEHGCGLLNGEEDMHSLLFDMKTVRIDDYMYSCGKEEDCVELLKRYITAEYEKRYGVDYLPLSTLPEKSDYQTYERYMITNLVSNRRIGRFVEVIANEIYYVDLYYHDIFMLHNGAEQTFELVFSLEDEYAMPAVIDTDG